MASEFRIFWRNDVDFSKLILFNDMGVSVTVEMDEGRSLTCICFCGISLKQCTREQNNIQFLDGIEIYWK